MGQGTEVGGHILGGLFGWLGPLGLYFVFTVITLRWNLKKLLSLHFLLRSWMAIRGVGP